MMLKEAFEKRLKAVKDRTNAEKERKEKRNMMVKKAIKQYNYDEKYHFLYDRISGLFAELLKADLEHLNSGQTTKFSLASKWCPSLYSSYDYSTLFCESVASRLFPYDSCPEYKGIDEAHYVYGVQNRLQKEVLVPLHNAWSFRKFTRVPINGTYFDMIKSHLLPSKLTGMHSIIMAVKGFCSTFKMCSALKCQKPLPRIYFHMRY